MRKALRLFLILFPLLAFCLFGLSLHRPAKAANSEAYGVFIGLSADEIERLRPYRTVVIEPSAFTAEQIQALHAAGKTVYGYLNLGSLESYRPYYERFANLTLAPYENWTEERWVDVSSPVWQRFVVDELGAQYVSLGLDGFFLDNCDVYALYPRENIFNGLTTMLRGLSQESVFTKIDFSKKRYTTQDAETRAYYLDYLARAKEAGLKVYLIEYRPTAKLAAEIQDYCEKNGFVVYLAYEKELR